MAQVKSQMFSDENLLRAGEMQACSIVRKGCTREQEAVCFLTVALHRVGLVLRGGLHHLLHHVSLPMGCSQGHHEEEDACYS